jgi:hypothetical protein
VACVLLTVPAAVGWRHSVGGATGFGVPVAAASRPDVGSLGAVCAQKAVPPPSKQPTRRRMLSVSACWSVCGPNAPPELYLLMAGSPAANLVNGTPPPRPAM